MAYQTVNPYDNQIVATFDDLTDEQAMDLLAQAQKTFESWNQTSFAERAAVVRRAAAIFRERSDEFARLLTLEMGKLYTEALGEVGLGAQILDYYAENAEVFLAPEPLDTASPDDNAMLVSAPLGVILGVQPWNFPYYQLARVAAPNLMAGNVVIVKGTPLTVTMCTPGSDVELAQSFLLTEGLIAHRDDVITVRYCRGRTWTAPTPTRLLDEDEPIILTNLFGKMSKTPEQ